MFPDLPAARSAILAALLAVASVLPFSSASALTWGWTGTGGNVLWSNGGNWDQGTAPPSDIVGTSVNFSTAGGGLSTVDYALSLRGLAFGSSAGAFTLGGSQLALGSGGISQDSANTQTINNAVALFGLQTWRVSAGILDMNGTISGNGTSTLTKSGAGTLVLDGANTYGGGTTLSAGTIQFSNSTALGSGTVTFGDRFTSTNGTTLLATQVMNPFTSPGNGVYQTSFANNVVVSANGTGTVTIGTTAFSGQSTNGYNGTIFSGNFQLNRATTFLSGNSDYTHVSGVISGNVGLLTITGGRRFVIGNAKATNTFTGDIQVTGSGTVFQVNGNSASNAVPDSTSIDLGAGTTLKLSLDGSGNVAVNESINALTGSGTVQIHETVSNAHTLTVGAGGGTGTFSGNIVNGGAGGAVLSIAKSGTGTQTLSGFNSYSGTTAVGGGTLAIDNANTTTARLANTSGITINNGGTLLLTQSGATVSTDRLNNNAGITLAGGGQFQTAGLSEGTRPAAPAAGNAGAAGMGALTLTGTTSALHATIDFGSGSLGSSLVFSSLSAAGGYLDILNWTGTAGGDNGTAGFDRLLFASNPGAQDLSHFAFYNDNGSLYGVGASVISHGNMYELVATPVPEPGTWAAGLLAFGVLGCSQRRRLKAVVLLKGLTKAR